jgi:hypothetical protein
MDVTNRLHSWQTKVQSWEDVRGHRARIGLDFQSPACMSTPRSSGVMALQKKNDYLNHALRIHFWWFQSDRTNGSGVAAILDRNNSKRRTISFKTAITLEVIEISSCGKKHLVTHNKFTFVHKR